MPFLPGKGAQQTRASRTVSMLLGTGEALYPYEGLAYIFFPLENFRKSHSWHQVTCSN